MIRTIRTADTLTFSADHPLIAYQGRMLEALPVLMPLQQISDHELRYQKDAPGLPLSRWVRSHPDAEELRKLLQAFSKDLELLEGFLLDPEKIRWDPSFTFWDAPEKTLRLLYAPWEVPPAQGTSFLKGLSLLLWKTACRDEWDDEACALVMRAGLWAEHPERSFFFPEETPIVRENPSDDKSLLLPSDKPGSSRQKEMEEALNDLMAESSRSLPDGPGTGAPGFFRRLWKAVRDHSPIEITDE